MFYKQSVLGFLITVAVSSAMAADFKVQCQLEEIFDDGSAATSSFSGDILNVKPGYEKNFGSKSIDFVLKPGILGVSVSISTNKLPSIGFVKSVSVGTYQIGKRIKDQAVLESGTTAGSKYLKLSEIDGYSGSVPGRIVIYNPQGDYCTPTQGGYGECPPTYPGVGNPSSEPIGPEVISEVITTCDVQEI